MSMHNDPTVLVTDGESRSSLAVTRSLGRYGCRVVVTGEQEKNIASCSRYCNLGRSVSSPIDNVQEFVNDLLTIVLQEQIDIIYPMTEPSVLALANNREAFSDNVVIAAPELEQVEAVFDKYTIFRHASQLGVPIPDTLFVKDREDYLQKKWRVPTFPAVVKPAMSRIPVAGGFLKTGVMYAKNEKELDNLYATADALLYPSLIQERIIGPGTGLFTLFDQDRHLALFSHKRLREKPPSGGVSVCCESVPLDGEMVSASQKLLAEVGWKGVAMVEFKRDKRDGVAKLMEINGRFWGSLQLAISSGIDFPLLLLQYLQNRNYRQGVIDHYTVGLRMKWLLGTLDHLLIRLRNADDRLNLPPGSPIKWRALLEFLKIKQRNSVFDVLQISDLQPFVYELIEYVADILSPRNG